MSESTHSGAHPIVPPCEQPAEAPDAAPVSPVAPGDVIGERYVVGELIGEGGMGVVCEAKHLALGVRVAIKLIRPAFKHDFEFVQRFLNEARRAALLKSEHVARVHDVGQLESGEPYLVMEHLDGVVLDTYLQRAGPLLPADAVSLALQVCDGLAEAHAQGVVHRDIKPGNLFLVHLPNGRISVKILDFGISKQLKDDAPSTLTNRDKSLGSPWYMSPEQMMDSSSVDHRSDVWSLGVVLFELLTNRRPFDGTSVPEVCAKVLTGGTPSLVGAQSDIDPGLEAVVFRCLAKEPDDRYPDVLALADALEPFARRDTPNGQRAWEPVGDLLSTERLGQEPGSIAPLSTTRGSSGSARSGRSRRARSVGLIGIALAAVAACLALANEFLHPVSNLGGQIAWPGAPALAPGPEPLPLDRGNTPRGFALPNPMPKAPEVVPLPDAVGTLDALDELEVFEEPDGASRGTEAAPVPRVETRASARRRLRSPHDDNPYLGTPRVKGSALELREALGRLQSEYHRSLRTTPDDELEAPEPPEEDAEPAREDKVAPARKAPETPESAEARDRYGL